MRKNTAIARSLLLLAVAASTAMTSGCAVKAPAYDRTFEPFVDPVHGRVVRLNSSDGYVVLECAVLPIQGEQITLYRDRKPVARVRVTSLQEGRFAVADLVDGRPMQGDWFIGNNKGFIPQQRQ